MRLSVLSKNSRGFTIIETLVSLTIISVLVGLTAVGASQLTKRLLVSPSDAYLESILITASRRARDGVGGSDWGVFLPYDETTRVLSSITVFKGSSYALRDSAFDHVFPFSDKIDFVSVDFSGEDISTGNDHEIVFQRYSGETTMFGSVEIEVVGIGRIVTVTSQGIITREL